MEMAIYKVKVFFWTQNICIEDAKTRNFMSLQGSFVERSGLKFEIFICSFRYFVSCVTKYHSPHRVTWLPAMPLVIMQTGRVISAEGINWLNMWICQMVRMNYVYINCRVLNYACAHDKSAQLCVRKWCSAQLCMHKRHIIQLWVHKW